MCIEHFFLAVFTQSFFFFLYILCCSCTVNWRQKQYATISMKLSRQVKRSILKYYITRKMVSSESNNLLYQCCWWWKVQYVIWGGKKNIFHLPIMTSSLYMFSTFSCLWNVAMMCSKMKNKHVMDDITTDEFIFVE